MESVGRLAGGVAHDFNNKLSVILGNAEFAMEEVDPEHPAHDNLIQIQKAATQSAALTQQLLSFARKQTVKPVVLDLNETIASMLKMLARLIGEDIVLSWLPEASLWLIKMDPSQIDQILTNLCVNARDAIGGVGLLTIKTGNIVLDDAACAMLPGALPGEYVQLAIIDDGCGMDAETLAHVFEPFFTTKGMGQGTGLGLATVYGAVKQNGGYVSVRSEPGKGASVTIYLPRFDDAAKAACSEVTGRYPITGGTETILLVEDELPILKMLTTMLQRKGYKILPASTPSEAIRIAGQHPGQIHLLMTDVIMPEMNGRDLAKSLMFLHPGLKRLYMSGYTADIIAHHGVLDAGVHFLQKPFRREDLAVKLREALDSE